jgi:hypothetical protein
VTRSLARRGAGGRSSNHGHSMQPDARSPRLRGAGAGGRRGRPGQRFGVRAAAAARIGPGYPQRVDRAGDGAYLEILAPDPDQPPLDGPLWLGAAATRSPTSWESGPTSRARRRAEAAGQARGRDLRKPAPRGRRDADVEADRSASPHGRRGRPRAPAHRLGSSPHPAASAPAVTLAALRGDIRIRATPCCSEIWAWSFRSRGLRAALIMILDTPRAGGTW